MHDVKLSCHAGADVIVVDGMQGGTAATQDCYIEHAGIPEADNRVLSWARHRGSI